MQYSLPYILFVIFILVIATVQLGLPLDEKLRKNINNLVIIGYVLFFGFRGFIATDWASYYPFFNKLPTNILNALKESNFESGFVIYSVFIKNISPEYLFFQLFNTVTDVILLHIFFKRYLPIKYYALGFAVFLVYYGNGLEINLLRNFKSILLFLLALPYIEQRNAFKYFTIIIVALLFHWTSIFFLPLYFFLHKKISMRTFLIIFSIGSVIYLIQIQYLTPVIKLLLILLPVDDASKIANYLTSSLYNRSYGLTFGYFERTVVSFFILIFYTKITSSRQNILFVNSFMIFISLYLYCSEITIILERVAGIFAYSYWIMIPIIVMNIQQNIKPLALGFIAVLVIFKMYTITNFIFYDYDSFMFKEHKTYEERYRIFIENKKIFEKK